IPDKQYSAGQLADSRMPYSTVYLEYWPKWFSQLHVFAKTIWASIPDTPYYNAYWHLPAALHCTLLFIGQFSDEPYLAEQMAYVAHQLAPVTLTVAGQTHWLGRNSLALAATGAEHAGTEFTKQLGQFSADKRAGKRPF